MEFVELKKHIRTQKPFPCYACYGDDEFVLSRAVSHICGLVTALPELNIVDTAFRSASEMKEELMLLPVMSDYRVTVLRGKVDGAAVSEYLTAPNPSSVLVLVQYVPHDSWNRTAEPEFPTGSVPVNCNRLPVKYVYPFVRNIAADAGAQFADRETELLYERCGGYMSRIEPEAKKLAFMRSGGAVTADDIKEQVRPDAEYIVYELSDCILKKDGARALAIVDGMAKNNDLVAAFTLLYNRFKRIFAAAVDPDGLAALGIKPYMISKLKSEAAGFSKVRLKNIVDALANADFSYKTGAASQYDALYSFVAQAASGG